MARAVALQETQQLIKRTELGLLPVDLVVQVHNLSLSFNSKPLLSNRYFPLILSTYSMAFTRKTDEMRS